ncbi:heavy metal-associated isoprenylated plant protein 18 [Eutrema salsugineum]|nr:heavy metal-associated isoprenylated plant protein 18 [Eutrema salsugineum]
MTAVISKFKGVESRVVDREKQTILVTGSFNLEKLLKKLMKETNKEVEIVTQEEKDVESEIIQKREYEKLETIPEKNEETEMVQEEKEKEYETVVENDERPEEDAEPEIVIEPNSDDRSESEIYTMFSDENPNAKCTIM